MTAGLPPLVEPTATLTDEELGRYARQIILPGVGAQAQRRLKSARVLVIGAGGLGSPVLLYLAAAGVGVIEVIDDDVVDVTNLQRQVIHGMTDLGQAKTASAAAAITEINPNVTVVQHTERLSADNALKLIEGVDLVIDGADNFATRYMVSDAAELAGRPVVWGAILRFEGQVSVFWAGHGPTYRDIYPEPPEAGAVPSCALGGVLGTLPGLVGTVMATEAIKLITGVGESLLGRLLTVDAATGRWRTLRVEPDPARPAVTAVVDEALACAVDAAADAAEAAQTAEAEQRLQRQQVTPIALRELLARRAAGGKPFRLIDVREPEEFDIVHIDGAELVPQAELLEGRVRIDPGESVILTCRSGARSHQVLRTLIAQGHTDVRELSGGVLAWVRDVEPELPVY